MITLEQAQAFIEAVGSDFQIKPSRVKTVNLKVDSEPTRDMSSAFEEDYNSRLKSVQVDADSHYGKLLYHESTRAVQDRKRNAYVTFIPEDEQTYNVDIRYEFSDEECDFIINTVHVPPCGVDEHLASLSKSGKLLTVWQ